MVGLYYQPTLWDAHDKYINTYNSGTSIAIILLYLYSAAAGQQMDCEIVSSRHTISPDPFTENKPRCF